MDDVRIYTGTLIADLVLQRSQNLKDRRKPLRALIQRMRNHDFAVAQVGPADLIQRVFLAISVVSGNETQADELMDEAERFLFASEFEVGQLRRQIQSETFYSG